MATIDEGDPEMAAARQFARELLAARVHDEMEASRPGQWPQELTSSAVTDEIQALARRVWNEAEMPDEIIEFGRLVVFRFIAMARLGMNALEEGFATGVASDVEPGEAIPYGEMLARLNQSY